MFDYRWVKILESLYDNDHKLKREELAQNMRNRGVNVDENKLDRDLHILKDEGFIKQAMASGTLTLTDSGVRKVQVVRRGY